jgi:hypothetical protein
MACKNKSLGKKSDMTKEAMVSVPAIRMQFIQIARFESIKRSGR